MKKQGSGLSIEVVVIAALAITVMVVLVLLFTGKIGPFVKETEDCSRVGGKCVGKLECSPMAIAPQKCLETDKPVCCVNQCLVDGGACELPCIENGATPDPDCDSKCDIGKTRLYTFGCTGSEVCCK